MRDELERFFDSLILQYGILRVILAPFVLIGALAGAGLVTNGATSFVAILLSLFTAIAVISCLSLQLRSARLLLAERAKILSLYAERFIHSQEYQAYTIESWEEEVFVGKSGDTILENWLTIKADSSSVWWGIYRVGRAKPSIVNDSERRRIKFAARSFDSDRELGARYDVTSKWEGNWLWLFVHLDRAAGPGQVVRIWIRWEWPGHYKGLLDGQTEPVDWIMQRPAKRLTATLTFDKDCNLRDGFRVTPYYDCPIPKQVKTANSETVITAEYTNVNAHLQVGFKLDAIPRELN